MTRSLSLNRSPGATAARSRSRRHAASVGLLTAALGLAAVCVGVAVGPRDAGAQTDQRQAVTLEPAIADAFLSEMRGHMRTLDDIVLAMADGDYQEAATVAELRLGFGHRMWEAMAEQGMSDEDILAVRKAMQAQGMAQGQGRGQGMGPGQGRGFGRFMPEAFRAMGQGFHQAGARFAEVARALPESPSAAELTEALSALREVTAVCRACHDTYRIEVTRPEH